MTDIKTTDDLATVLDLAERLDAAWRAGGWDGTAPERLAGDPELSLADYAAATLLLLGTAVPNAFADFARNREHLAAGYRSGVEPRRLAQHVLALILNAG